MRVATTLMFAALCCDVCSAAGPAEILVAEPGKALSLSAGQFAQTRDGGLRVGFDGVIADSRCRKGQQCVWAGDATVRIWLQLGSGPKETRELHTSTGIASGTSAQAVEVQLLRLDPQPPSGDATATSAYVATLMLSQRPAVAPDR